MSVIKITNFINVNMLIDVKTQKTSVEQSSRDKNSKSKYKSERYTDKNM